MAESAIEDAARVICEAEALVIGAGAGMGVDSGLPDFRGPEGFWNAYPAYAKLGLDFSDLANPRWFASDPGLAWGFYGHRLNLYRATQPHPGFAILKRWGERMPHGARVFTSNVDGHFQRAGFREDDVTEVHGSIHFAQCMRGCGAGIFSADGFQVTVDPETFRASAPYPSCPQCGALARPNIFMFDDAEWDNRRTKTISLRLQAWLKQLSDVRIAIVELGAGTAIPSVRFFSEQIILQRPKATLIRINPREPQAGTKHVSVPMQALEAITQINESIQ